MLKREALSRRVVFVLRAGLVCAAAAVLPGGVPAEAGPDIEGEIVKTLPFRDRTGDNVLILSNRETRNGDTRDRELFAYRLRADAGGASRRVWRVYDFTRDCEYDPIADFYLNRVAVTDLDKDGVSEIWLPYALGCLSDPSAHDMKIIMYEGGQKYAMRGTSRALGGGPGDGGTMDAAFRSGPAVFRDHARRLWKRIDEDYTPGR